MAIAIAGLASAITYMGVWFDVLRIAGAAYLIWLGIKLVRSKGQLTAAAATSPRGGFFFQGFVVILSNPKVLLVFGALIPQFISKDGDYLNQLVLLGPELHGHRHRLRQPLCLRRRQCRLLAVAEAGALRRSVERPLPDRRRPLAGSTRPLSIVA
jgi:hypothetical protein